MKGEVGPDGTWDDREFKRGGFVFCDDPDCEVCDAAITARIAQFPLKADDPIVTPPHHP